MSTSEFEQKMKRIIKQTQQMYLTDAASRISVVQSALEEWKSGQSQTAAAIEAIHLQIHTMMGVALTIHFEPMHEICEALILMLEQVDMQEAERLIGQLPGKLEECRAITGGIS